MKKPKKKRTRIYFGKEMQQIIKKYIASDNQQQKDDLYKLHIHKAFTRIATSLAYKYKIESRIKNANILISECVSIMVERIDKFNPERGKAFTFFTVVARNFMLMQLNKVIKHNQKFKSINNINADGEQVNLLQICSEQDWEIYKQEKYSQIVLQHTIEKLINFIQQDYIPHKTNKSYQQQVAYAVARLMKDIDFLQNFNKKAIMLYITQMTGCNPYKINKVLGDLSKYYFKIKQEVIQTQLDLLQYQY